jgi:predicted transcriptional regulator of viral defense system
MEATVSEPPQQGPPRAALPEGAAAERQASSVLRLAHSKGALRARDLAALGVSRAVLGRLVAQGALLRVGRGLYMSPKADISAHHSLVEVAARVPGAVINLLSALAFHGLTDELPHAVWLAIARGAHAPRLDGPPLALTWAPVAALSVGVTRHRIEGVEVAVTDPARTVVDCFKHRRRVGIDVAIAALRALVSQEPLARDAVWQAAGPARMRQVIRPYLEGVS